MDPRPDTAGGRPGAQEPPLGVWAKRNQVLWADVLMEGIMSFIVTRCSGAEFWDEVEAWSGKSQGHVRQMLTECGLELTGTNEAGPEELQSKDKRAADRDGATPGKEEAETPRATGEEQPEELT